LYCCRVKHSTSTAMLRMHVTHMHVTHVHVLVGQVPNPFGSGRLCTPTTDALRTNIISSRV
jgi:hypothetical protein